tara:strand:- start:2364 stop:3791 length:1428 start_codon:yes stop_codon:yes gene_type:complete
MANDFFDFDAPKGSSVAFGKSLLGNIRSRKDKQAEDSEKFAKRILGAKIIGQGFNWVLDDKAEDFNRSNLGVYNRLDGLIKANQKVLGDELAIKESGGTAEQYFSQKFINTARDEATKNNRLFDYSRIKKESQTFGIEAATRHKSLYEKAKGMSVNIEDYKDVAQDTVQIPENMLDFIGFKVKNLFKEKDPRIAALKQDGITLETIAQLKQDGIFDKTLEFESMLKGMPSTERDRIIEVLDIMKEAPTEKQTTFQLVEDETTGKKGYKVVTVVNYADPDDTKIIESKDTFAMSNLAFDIYTDTRMNSFRNGATAAGMREFEMLVAAQDPSEKNKSFAGGLQHLRTLKTEGKDILEEIMAMASSKEEYITYEIGESSPEREATKATIISLERLMNEMRFDTEDPEERKELAQEIRKIVGFNRYITSQLTGQKDILDVDRMEELNKLDDDRIIGFINMLRGFGETADVTLSGSGMKP